ncbi:hypothetical protein K457DRAFT_25817 [Linnemannia elongata AG-77]|uniref:Crinkler effector protein N-terminal domain-containing protein n=1 Tax=Linnemannia elongata AG-77 TaxID=1314771 RepID=A0A197JCC3_9FUNG|nr:hypothetical protein K457DRAFT_25817 [Linnemannia elongata AG-77]
MTDNRMNIFCLVVGQPTSNAFSIRISPNKTVDDLKDLIKAKKAIDFKDIDANKLVLWQVAIPVIAANRHIPVVLSEVDFKRELLPTDDIVESALSKKNVHILIECPSNPTTDTNDPVLSFTVTVKGRIPVTFLWRSDIVTATLDELRNQIYAREDSLDDGLQVIMVYESDVNNSCYSYLETDDRLRMWLRRRANKNLLDFSIRLEGPPRPFADVTTEYADRIYNSDSCLPNQKVPSTMTDCTQALEDLFVSLKAAVKAAPPENRSGYSLYINAFLVHAVGLFPDLRLSLDVPVSGRRGYGSIPFVVQSKTDKLCMLPVTVTGSNRHISDIGDGIAHNKVQLDVISSNRKRKFEDDADDTDDTDDTVPAKSVPTKSYGIVTDAEMWVFLQCAVDASDNTGYNDPVFHRYDSTASVNYFSQGDKWKADVQMTFEHLVWQLQRMVDDLSPKNKRFKPQ